MSLISLYSTPYLEEKILSCYPRGISPVFASTLRMYNAAHFWDATVLQGSALKEFAYSRLIKKGCLKYG